MSEWGVRRPPASDEELARWTVAQAPQLQLLRAGLQDAVLHHADLDEIEVADRVDLAERIAIVATELAGNALRHGHPPTVVVLQRSQNRLVVDVLDGDSHSVPAVVERAPGEGGLGLVLTERLAENVGWYPTAAGGKGVWAAFALAR
ncbi:ATP-binding protein [Mangrovihabitans endophyticus]|nr:ATP-binding protein [Mangrovihabitans endophyticus]